MREEIMDHSENHWTHYTSQITSSKICVNIMVQEHCHKQQEEQQRGALVMFFGTLPGHIAISYIERNTKIFQKTGKWEDRRCQDEQLSSRDHICTG